MQQVLVLQKEQEKANKQKAKVEYEDKMAQAKG